MVVVHAWGPVDYVRVAVDPDNVGAWADSATALLNQSPRVAAGEELELDARLAGAGGDDVKLIRTVKGGASLYAVFISDEYVIDSVYEALSIERVRLLIGDIRAAAAAAQQMRNDK